MLYHVRESNLLLRHQDYNRDGYPDCVGLHVTGVGSWLRTLHLIIM